MQRLTRLTSFSFAIALFLFSRVIWADTTGSIAGTIRDPSNAIVGGARVVATNTDNNFAKEALSDAEGQYRILALPPGPYRITAGSNGFQESTVSGVDLKVNDQQRIDLTLSVGSVQQKMTVEANPVAIETESTQLGGVIDSQKMLSMPLNGRSFLDLLGLQAGVVPVSAGTVPNDRPVSGMFSSPGNVSVNGQPESANAFLVNGGDVSEAKNMGAGLVPNLDSIAEFRLITNSFDAEYGRFSGAVMNAITKSGTNSFHGSAFEFLRNDAMDARNFFDPVKAELRRNQFGYAVGGPLWKNKLFWFTDYQGTRQVTGASTGLVELPTAAQRQGVFTPSDFLGSDGNPMTVNGSYWASVLSQRLGYQVQNGESYSSASCSSTAQCVFPGGVIPQAAFDKVSVNMAKYIPLPNQGSNLFSDVSGKGTIRDDKAGQRVDFVNQKAGNWSFYYHFDDSTVYNPLNASVPGFSSTSPSRAQMFTVSDVKTFGPSMVNEFRVSAFRTSVQTAVPKDGLASLSELGFTTGVGTLGIVPSGPAGYPEILPPTSFNSFSLGVNWLNMFQANNTYMLTDGLSKVVGQHSLKFGGEFRTYQLNVRNVCAPNGTFSFSGSETGSDYADFLLGAPSSYVQCTEQFLDNRTKYGGLFIQDSWKLKPNFNINLGLRWEVSAPWSDSQGKLETLVPGVQSVQFPTAPPGYLVPGDPGVPASISPTEWKKFAPRIGIAYSPAFSDGFLGKLTGGPGKTSIRAAYGLYYLTPADLGNFGVIGDAPFGLYWQSPAPTMFDSPFQTRSDGSSQGQRFPFTFPTPGDPANKTLNFTQFLPLYSPGYSNTNVMTYAEHYNFTIQRELSSSTVLTAAYVGTQSHHIQSTLDLNVGSGALCNQLNALGATPRCGPGAETSIFTLPNNQKIYGTMLGMGNQAIGEGTGLVAYGQTQLLSNIGNSSYSALQLSAERKAADVTFLASYTYSKSIDNANGELNPFNYALSRVLSPFDMRHNFVVSYNWNIPFDRAFTRLPKRLTSGWNVTGISRFTTGLPVKLSQSGDLSLTNVGLDLPNVVGPVVTQDPRNAGPGGQPNTYFLRSAFASEQLGTIGDAAKRFFAGPGIINTDFGLSKNTRIRESMSLVIRAEFFNVFNHTNFNNPVGNFSSGQFGSVTSARDPRIGQISAKFVW